MNLGFKTHINKKPTFFVEKIWHSIHEPFKDGLISDDISNDWHTSGTGILDQSNYDFEYGFFHPKIHTIREDEKDRWKVGNKIHFVINNRTKNRFQFAPVLEVKSIQYIRILWHCGEPTVYTSDNGMHDVMPFYIGDDKGETWYYGKNQMLDLSKNDGFDSIEHFFGWFKEDFDGKIIHWTDYKYT